MAESQNAHTVRTTLMPWANTCKQTAEFLEGEAERDTATLTYGEWEAAFILTREVRDLVGRCEQALEVMRMREIRGRLDAAANV